MQLFPRNILSWFRHQRGYNSIDFRRYIWYFCVEICFRENWSAYMQWGG